MAEVERPATHLRRYILYVLVGDVFPTPLVFLIADYADIAPIPPAPVLTNPFGIEFEHERHERKQGGYSRMMGEEPPHTFGLRVYRSDDEFDLYEIHEGSRGRGLDQTIRFEPDSLVGTKTEDYRSEI